MIMSCKLNAAFIEDNSVKKLCVLQFAFKVIATFLHYWKVAAKEFITFIRIFCALNMEHGYKLSLTVE